MIDRAILRPLYAAIRGRTVTPPLLNKAAL